MHVERSIDRYDKGKETKEDLLEDGRIVSGNF